MVNTDIKPVYISYTQYKLLRFILGIYLAIHFIFVLNDSSELFSNNGMIKTTYYLPGKNLPLLLLYNDNSYVVHLFIISLIISSLLLSFGIFQKIISLWLFYGWINLFNRNPFISNPSIGYIGWLLLLHAIIKLPCGSDWKYPKLLYYGYWLIVALSYTISGIHKLSSPSWINGTAIYHILNGLLSRNNFITNIILAYPLLSTLMTWSALFIETSFLFFGLFSKFRPLYWIVVLFMHVGILLTHNFTDLTIGMIISHLYLFDNRWISQFYKKSNIPLWVKIIYAITIPSFGFIVHKSINDKILYNILDIKITSNTSFILIIIVMFAILLLESKYPDQKVKWSYKWILWAFTINIVQLFVSILAGATWEKWLYNYSMFESITNIHLRNYVTPFIGGIIAYIVNQWIFYWWHYMRHQLGFLWIYLHQFHHSANRIEVITSFYKHPLEIISDSILMSILIFPILGLTPESNLWLSIFSAFGEFFYHMNIKTPHWIGYFFQRPESHRKHHSYNARYKCPNNSDFPIFDMLNDTFDNPIDMNNKTGFSDENKRLNILMFKDTINNKYYNFTWRKSLYTILILWGISASFFFFINQNISKAITLSTASPYPVVFTAYNGVETFTTNFTIITNKHIPITHTMYSKLDGSYNKRNVYGAMFAYGPLFTNNNLIQLRNEILYYGMCEPGLIKKQLGLYDLNQIVIMVKSNTENNNGTWWLNMTCN